MAKEMEEKAGDLLCESVLKRAPEIVESQPGENPELSPEKILSAAIIGIVAALGYDIGIAFASGPPLTANETLADIISGFIGGALGEVVLELSNNNILGTGTGAFLTGFVYQLVIQSLPSQEPPAEAFPKRRAKSQKEKVSDKRQPVNKTAGPGPSSKRNSMKKPFHRPVPVRQKPFFIKGLGLTNPLT